ncbi:hypothetical protein [Microcoleus asticus]|uniref:Uncharacterized protein n=1 Tax=Microcoleus asticus IPMA8 TaxID=2563858 RepID=A0ABX2D1B8_9CYAN|nr:hypothetical protein [Microcoleus asticus]NQE35465.1 hypothetical protein [Microcoleus asticus IPMA8]
MVYLPQSLACFIFHRDYWHDFGITHIIYCTGLEKQELVSCRSIAPPPMYRQLANARPAAADATTPVVGGEQQVEAFVTLQIGY